MVIVVIIVMLVMGILKIVPRMVIMMVGKGKWTGLAISMVIWEVKSVEKV